MESKWSIKDIERWRVKSQHPQFIKVRAKAESEARNLLLRNMGSFEKFQLKQLLDLLNTEYITDDARKSLTRFRPAFMGKNQNDILENMNSFNKSSAFMIAHYSSDIKSVLQYFWEKEPIKGGATGLASALLYLMDNSTYNVWLPSLSIGLQNITGSYYNTRIRTINNYLTFNMEVNDLRKEYNLIPQEVDYILFRSSIEI